MEILYKSTAGALAQAVRVGTGVRRKPHLQGSFAQDTQSKQTTAAMHALHRARALSHTHTHYVTTYTHLCQARINRAVVILLACATCIEIHTIPSTRKADDDNYEGTPLTNW